VYLCYGIISFGSKERSVDTDNHSSEAAQNEKAEKTWKNLYLIDPRKDSWKWRVPFRRKE